MRALCTGVLKTLNAGLHSDFAGATDGVLIQLIAAIHIALIGQPIFTIPAQYSLNISYFILKNEA